ncbi:MAG: SRPBCC family protein [Chloroflexota bacterium]
MLKKIGKILAGLLGILILAIGLSYLLAPNTIELHLETEIDAPAEEVWQILAHQFDDIDTWSASVSESQAITLNEVPNGFTADPASPYPGRITIAGPGVKATEVITEYSEEDMMFTFEGVDLPPLVFEYAKDTQRIIPMGEGKSKVTFDVSMKTRGIFKAVNPLLAARFTSSFTTIQQELKVYAETGQVLQ